MNYIKKLFIIFIEAFAVTAMFLLAIHAHAQVSVTFAGNPAANQFVGGYNSCYLSGTAPGGLASSRTATGDPILIWPDSKDYAITGNYAVDMPNCNSSQYSGATYQLCLSVVQAFQNAIDIANGMPGFPHMTDSGTATNLIQLQIGGNTCTRGILSGASAGQQAGMCENNQQFPNFPNASNGYSIVATIYVNPDSAQSQIEAPSFASNPTFGTCTLAHEMSHAFGVADIRNYTGPSLMGSECSPGMSPSSEQTPGNPWDSATAATIKALNSNSSVSVDVSSCQVGCGLGQYQRFTKNAEGVYVAICSTSASPATDPYSCDCRGSNPTCFDDVTRESIPVPAGACTAPDPDSLSCSCSASESGCEVDPNISIGPNTILYPPPAGVCSSSDVPPGEVCSCALGEASCIDTDGNDVAVPPSFNCQPDQSSGGYSSDDDAYPQYACESSFCTYIGEGPDYSDPTCGGGCNSD